MTQLTNALQAARPVALASGETLQALDEPLFLASRRVAVVSLSAPGALSETALENALDGLARDRLLLAGARAELSWTDRETEGRRWRVLSLPMLGWELC